jgi:glycosyltransferase involved in cell wall biosynthesis
MKQKKIILFLNENPLPKVFTRGTISGKELRLRSAIKQIDEVHVIARQGNAVQDPNDKQVGKLEKKIKIHLLPPWPYYLACFPLFLWGFYYCLKLKPKTIEAESPIISGPAAILLGKIFKIPSIVEVRASYEELIKQKFKFVPLKLKRNILDFIYIKTLNGADIVISNSVYYQLKLKINNIESIVINPGLQNLPDILTPVKNEVFTIGFLGRLVPEKRVDILLNAFAKLKKYKINLEIAGDGPSKKNLIKLTKALKINKKVKFLGMSNNYKVLSRWRLMVNPIQAKTPLEMVNAEAAYSQVPAIGFGNKNYPETIVHQKTGIKLSKIDSQTLAETIEKLYKDNNLLKKLSRAGKDFALANYSFDKQVKKLRKVYIKLPIFSTKN